MECRMCGESRTELFYAGNKTRCKQCIKVKANAKYQSKTPDERMLYMKAVNGWQNKNTIRVRFLGARTRAKNRGHMFTITEEFINQLWTSQNGKCFYSGLDMKKEMDDAIYSVSLDRKDNSLGYIPSNTILCCSAVNIMKNNLSPEQFKNLITNLYKNIKLW